MVRVFLKNGVYLPRHVVAFQEFLDIERVEVLRGPQGTLYGRNATGGAVNIIRKRPTNEFEVSARFDVGNFDKLGFAGSISGALVSDRVFGRLTYSRQKRENYSYNSFLDETLDGRDSNYASLSLVFQATDNFEAVLRLSTSREDAAGNLAYKNIVRGPSTLPALPEPEDPFIVNNDYSPAGLNNNESDSAGLTLSWNNGDLTIRSITGYRDISTKSSFDTDGTNLNLGFNIFQENSEMFSQELQLLTPIGDRINVVAGVYYYDEDNSSNLDFQFENDPIVCAAFAQSAGCFATTSFVSANKTKAWAVFGELTWSVTDRFRMIVGGRYSDEEKSFETTGGFLNFLLDIGPFIGLPFLIPFDASGVGSDSDMDSWSDFTGRVVAEFDVNEDVLFYASVAEGFKSGGFNSSDVGIVVSPFLTGSGPQGSFGPETLLSFEVGIKGSFLDGRVSGALSAFTYDYSDLQVRFVDSINATLPIRNAASASVFGVEFEGQALITDYFRLDWALTHLDSNYDDFPDAQDLVTGQPVDLTGESLLRTPKFKASLGAEYTVPLENAGALTFRADLLHQSKQRFGQSAEPFFEAGDFTYVNARVTWSSQSGHWYVSAWGQNLNDELYEITKSFNNLQGGGVIFAQPRTYGLTVGINY